MSVENYKAMRDKLSTRDDLDSDDEDMEDEDEETEEEEV